MFPTTVTHSQEVAFYLALVGLVVSAVGAALTFWQARKARTAAEAAKAAASGTRQLITSNLFLFDIAEGAKSVEEIKAHVRAHRFESSHLRVSDLVTQLCRLRELAQREGPSRIDLEGMIAQLASMRDLLERKVNDRTLQISGADVNGVLSKISDSLNAWIGARRMQGGQND